MTKEQYLDVSIHHRIEMKRRSFRHLQDGEVLMTKVLRRIGKREL